jgi:hypothetical protein
MARDAYKSEKRRKELERQKKQAEKREKRLKKNEGRTEAEVLADLFGVPYESSGEAAEVPSLQRAPSAKAPMRKRAPAPRQPKVPARRSLPADP